jgi:hypothetical protein
MSVDINCIHCLQLEYTRPKTFWMREERTLRRVKVLSTNCWRGRENIMRKTSRLVEVIQSDRNPTMQKETEPSERNKSKKCVTPGACVILMESRKSLHMNFSIPTMSSVSPINRCIRRSRPARSTCHSSCRIQTTVAATQVLRQRCEHHSRLLSRRAAGVCFVARIKPGVDRRALWCAVERCLDSRSPSEKTRVKGLVRPRYGVLVRDQRGFHAGYCLVRRFKSSSTLRGRLQWIQIAG